jgi:uncharacterized protein
MIKSPIKCSFLAALSLLVNVAQPSMAQQIQPAQPVPKREGATVNRERLNLNTVGIVTSRSGSTHLAIVEDIASVVDNGDELRVLPTIGKGAAQNVRDALFMKNMDMGVTTANVMSYLKKTGELGSGVENRLVYITKLFNEEVHIVAGSQATDLRSLAGKVVNFGEAGSGTDLTAQLVFDSLKIKVIPANVTQAQALLKIKAGEMAATVVLAGKPANLFDKMRSNGDYKLLPIPYEEALEADYLPSKLTHEDYPDLIAQGENVDTISVAAVLAAYNWPANSDRHRRLSRFVEVFFQKFPELRNEPYHPKWREVNLVAELPGWNRFPVARNWLATRAAPPAATTAVARVPVVPDKNTFEQFMATQGGAPKNAAGEQALFEKFMAWTKGQAGTSRTGASQPTSGTLPAGGAAQQPPASRLW